MSEELKKVGRPSTTKPAEKMTTKESKSVFVFFNTAKGTPPKLPVGEDNGKTVYKKVPKLTHLHKFDEILEVPKNEFEKIEHHPVYNGSCLSVFSSLDAAKTAIVKAKRENFPRYYKPKK